MTCLIAYDIADDTRRTRVVTVLLDYAQRVQESVFWADIDDELLERLWSRIRRIVDEKEDSVWLTPVCAACAKRIQIVGKIHVPVRPEFYVL